MAQMLVDSFDPSFTYRGYAVEVINCSIGDQKVAYVRAGGTSSEVSSIDACGGDCVRQSYFRYQVEVTKAVSVDDAKRSAIDAVKAQIDAHLRNRHGQ